MAALDVVVRYIGNSDSAVRAAKDVESSNQRLSSTLTKTGLALTAAVTAPMVLMAKSAIREMENAGKVTAQTNAVLKSTGGVANVSAKQVDELATSIMNYSGMDDEAVKSGENLLLTFTRVRNEAGKGNDIFTQATKLSADLATAWGIDMNEAAIKVGKALQDPVKGLTALNRVGVTFTEQQKEQVKAMVASGDVIGAQKVILKELETQVGGSARAYGETLAGQLSKARETMLNTGAAIVGIVAPAMTLFAGIAQRVAGFLGDLPGPARTAVAAFALFAFALGPILTIVGNLASIGRGAAAVFSFIADAAGAATGKVASWVIGMESAAAGLGILGGAIAVAVAVGYGLHKLFGEDLTAGFKKAQEAGVQWGNSLAMNSSQIVDLTARHDQLLAALREVDATHVQSLTDVIKVASAHDTLKQKIAEVEAQQRAAKAAEDERLAVLFVLSQQTQGLTNATNEQIQALMALTNQYLASQGGALGYQAAQLQVESAQKNLDDLIAGGSIPTSFEYRQAVNQLEQAKLQAAGAAIRMSADEQTLANTLSHDGVNGLIAMKNTLLETIRTHGDATGAIAGQVAQIDALIQKTNATPTAKEGPNFETNAQEVILKLYELNSAADVATRTRQLNIDILTSGSLPGGAGIDGYQSGGVVPGPIGAPRLAIVHGGEEVIPANERGLGGSNNVIFNIHVSGVMDRLAAQQIGTEIGETAADALARRGVIVAARTG